MHFNDEGHAVLTRKELLEVRAALSTMAARFTVRASEALTDGSGDCQPALRVAAKYRSMADMFGAEYKSRGKPHKTV